MKKGLLTGSLTGVGCIAVGYVILLLDFPYPKGLLLGLYLILAPSSLLIYKYNVDVNLSMNRSLLVACTAYLTMISTYLLILAASEKFSLSMIAGVSFFSLLFGFILSAVSANLISK